jgi:hypothetical protein
MSDISLSTQQVLAQALKQLSTSSAAPIAKAGVEITVQNIVGNQTILANQKNNRTLTVPHASLQGKLSQNTTYESRFSDKQGKPTIEFFAQNTKSTVASQIGSLNRQQLTRLLELPQTKLIQNTGQLEKPIKAEVKSISASKITVNLQGSGQQIDIARSGKLTTATQNLKVGDIVGITLVPTASKGSITLLIPESKQTGKESTQTITPANLPVPNKPLADVAKSHEHSAQLGSASKLVAETIARSAPSLSTTNIEATLSNKAMAALMGQIVMSSAKGTASTMQLDANALATMVRQNNALFSGDLASKIVALKTSEISLVKASSGQVNLLAATEKPIAAIQLSQGLVASAKALLSENTQAPRADTTTKTSDKTSNSVDVSKNLKEIHALLRKLQPVTDSPSKSMHAIEQSSLAIKDIEQSSVKQLLEIALGQIKQKIPSGKADDALNIRQILSGPAQLLNTSQLVNVNNNNGMIGGLVTLLQLTLAARLSREQPQLAQRISNLLGLSSPITKTGSSQTSRVVQDLNQIQQRHQLLKEIGRLLAGHHSSKLSNAEQAIQGQESFYYLLPTNISNQFKDIELLIKREKEQEDSNGKEQKQTKTWHLTMKMDISDIGQLLSKAKVIDNGLELSFYSSNEQVKERVVKFLPQLISRLNHLGIEVMRSDCQLGKIPESLQKRPYHLFETQA